MYKQIEALLENNYEEMVEIRRYLHQHPELSFQETETPKYIADYHEKLGHTVRTNVGGRGVVAELNGGKEGPVIALRADFDALPMQDGKDVPYKSKVPGVTHACGHDAHTALLLVLAKALNAHQDELCGKIVFIHQFAEEVIPGGAVSMIDDGCLEGVDEIYGTHLWATTPTGKVEYNENALMAASDRFTIELQGTGGHGAQPHKTRDSILAATRIVDALHHLVSRQVDPLDSAVLSIGSFEAENAFNVIADKAVLRGTVRTFNEETQSHLIDEIERTAESIATAYGTQAEVRYVKGYPALINDAEKADNIRHAAAEIDDIDEVIHASPQMGGEDFAYYLLHRPGAFFFTGAQHPEWETTYPHHHPKFDIDEQSMLNAAKILAKTALNATEK